MDVGVLPENASCGKQAWSLEQFIPVRVYMLVMLVVSKVGAERLSI